MIRFSNGDPGGVPLSLSSGVDTLSSAIAPILLARVVTGGSLPQFTEAREEDINSSHWWLGVITDSQFNQFIDAGTGVKTRRDALQAGRKRSRGVLKVRGTPEYLLLGGFDFTFSNLNVFPYPLRQWRKV